MDGGKRPDIALEAGIRPLASSAGLGGKEEEEEGSCSSSSTAACDIELDDPTHSPAMFPGLRPIIPPPIDLKSVAASALSAVQAPAPAEPRGMEVEEPSETKLAPRGTFSLRHVDRPTSLRQ
ncbi:hypothetical protein PG994_015160 [Apiospora phragmitis]|uniref:Uncharacterized protein n=1 Tax=Apiospora phragmitis TaxID=2905665 RepID=A0ABR1SVQ5_9PEZI